MAAFTFAAKSVIELDGRQYRLLRKLPDDLWQLEEVRTLRVFEYGLKELWQRHAVGELTFVPECASAKVGRKLQLAVSEVPKEKMDKARVSRAYVTAVRHLPTTKSVMERAIHQVWKRLGQPETEPSWTTVYRWSTDYLDSNCDIRSLVKDNGNRGKWERNPKELLDIADDSIDKVWMTLERHTIQDTVDHAQAMVDAENAKRPSSLTLPRATRRLIRRLIDRIPAFDRCAARFGIQAARVRFRGVKGHHLTTAPLQRVEIDSTQIDLFVIDDDFRPLGRPTLTICIDNYSRCVLGIDISFEPPSYVTASRCLRQAFTAKVSLRTDFPEIENEWTPFGVMQTLVVDNALEFHSDALDRACETLGIEIIFAPRKTPWYKGQVERFIGTFNKALRCPGTTFGDIFERGDYDPAKHAVITLSTLQLLARKWIVDVYHQKPHRTLQAPPIAVWTNSIKPDDIPLPDSLAQLDAVLGRRVARVLSHKGVEFDGLFYNSPELIQLRRRHGERLDVEISVNDSDLGSIHVFDPKEKGLHYPAKALLQEYAAGLTRWQHKVIKKYAAERLRSFDWRGWVKAKEAIRTNVEAAVTNKKMNRRRRARWRAVDKPTVKSAPAPMPGTQQAADRAIRASAKPKYRPIVRTRPRAGEGP